MTRWEISRNILDERDRQDALWGPHGGQDKMDLTTRLAVLAEEFGEVAHAVLEADFGNLSEELVQVAAVCVAWLEVA